MISNRWCSAVTLVAMLACCHVASGQEENQAEQAGAVAFERPEITDEPPPQSTFERVDGIFADAVNVIATVLFYQLGKTERDYIVFERNSVYIRSRGSTDLFQNLNPDDPGQPQTLTDEQVELLAAQGRLVDGHTIEGSAKYYRLGSVDGQPIEYVTIKQDSPDGTVSYGDRFSFNPESTDYQIISAKRNLLGEQTLTQATVDEFDQLGFLKQNSSPRDGQPAYRFTESIAGIPIVVAWLAAGAVFFTLYMRGFNFWGFSHAVAIVRGKYDNPEETGEVTHFQALASALSATIGLGNIAGVTIAMTLGGPGAFFWMLVCGLFGMCTKFTECTLGQKYRHVKPDGTVLGGPMRYPQSRTRRNGSRLAGDDFVDRFHSDVHPRQLRGREHVSGESIRQRHAGGLSTGQSRKDL